MISRTEDVQQHKYEPRYTALMLLGRLDTIQTQYRTRFLQGDSSSLPWLRLASLQISSFNTVAPSVAPSSKYTIMRMVASFPKATFAGRIS